MRGRGRGASPGRSKTRPHLLLATATSICRNVKKIRFFFTIFLQVWPSTDSPRGEADGQSFIFPVCAEDAVSTTSVHFYETHHNDSGIESIQVIVLSVTVMHGVQF